MRTYPLEAFLDLQRFLRGVFADIDAVPRPVQEFLAEQQFSEVWAQIRKNTASADALCKRFFRWFDGFMALKLIHYLRDKYYGAQPVCDEAQRLWRMLDPRSDLPPVAVELLRGYRERQRKNWAFSAPPH